MSADWMLDKGCISGFLNQNFDFGKTDWVMGRAQMELVTEVEKNTPALK